MANLVASPGTASVEALIARCGSGLFIHRAASGTMDPESGRFVLFVETADVIRRGKRGAAVAGFALTGETLSALAGIESEWGDEASPASGLGRCMKRGDEVAVGAVSPALLVRGLSVRPVTR